VARIFISYRVAGQAAYAELLDRELGRHFGKSSVFLAPRSIRPGADFPAAILVAVRTSAVLLAVIGPGWMTDDPAGRRPYGGVDDWVRREVAEALDAGRRVIPVLVGGADLPVESELPEELAPVTRCQAVRLSSDSLGADLDRLTALLRDVLQPGDGPRPVRLFRSTATAADSCLVGVLAGGIREVRIADVWVNSENTDMVMARFTDFSVSGIIRYWGAVRDIAGRVTADVVADELSALVGDRGPVAPATALVTGSGALSESNSVRHVVHVAAVRGEPGRGFFPVRDVAACVPSALAAADTLAAADERVRTILFPLLGTGTGGIDPADIAGELLRAAVDYLIRNPATSLRTIYFLASTPAERDALGDAIERRPDLVAVPGDEPA
jgi:O-acetyl-ADP-ribose deacetylase (regulator of RNase III)